MQARITKKLVDQVQPGATDILVFDTDLKGFVLKVTPNGARTYLVRYRLGGRSTPLRKFTIGRHGSPWTPELARKEAEKLLASVRQGTDPTTEKKARQVAGFTVAELADRYLTEHVDVKNKALTAKSAHRMVKAIIKPRIGGLVVAKVTRADVSTLHHRLQSTPRQANHVLSVLSKMFNLAEVWGFRKDGTNPCRLIQRFEEAKRDRYLTDAEVAKLAGALAQMEEDRSEQDTIIAAIWLLLMTGCRLGEILALRWDDVDLAGQVFTVRDGKTGTRTNPIGDRAAAMFDALPRTGEWVLSGRDPKRPLSSSTIEHAWQRIRKTAGLEDVRLHDLRHTVGTYAGQAGANAFLVRDKLGHKTLAMTGRYVSRDADPVRELSNVIEERVSAAKDAGTRAPVRRQKAKRRG